MALVLDQWMCWGGENIMISLGWGENIPILLGWRNYLRQSNMWIYLSAKSIEMFFDRHFLYLGHFFSSELSPLTEFPPKTNYWLYPWIFTDENNTFNFDCWRDSFCTDETLLFIAFSALILSPSGLDNECLFFLFSWTSASSVSLQGLSFEAAGLKYA